MGELILEQNKTNTSKLIYGKQFWGKSVSLREIDGETESIIEKGWFYNYVALDLETTGFSPVKDKIIEIGAVKVVNGKITDRFSTFVNPDEPIPDKIVQLTSITSQMVADAPFSNEVLPEFLRFCEGSILVAHNASFDMGFIKQKARELTIDIDVTYVDTLTLARALLPALGRYGLDNVAKALKVSPKKHHRAVDDAECTGLVFIKLVSMLKEQGFNET